MIVKTIMTGEIQENCYIVIDENTKKTVYPLFFEKRIINDEPIFYIWQYEFTNPLDYNSIHLVKSGRYRIIKNEH